MSNDATGVSPLVDGDLSTLLFNLRVSNYTVIAGCVIWAYDILLTLDDEVSLLWSRGGKLIKLLYLINRYLPLLGFGVMIYGENADGRGPMTTLVRVRCTYLEIASYSELCRCQAHFSILTLVQVIGVIVATTILTVRVYTIYNGNRLARTSLLILAVASHVAILTCALILIIQIVPTMSYSDTFRFCLGDSSLALGGMYATPIVLETTVAFATLIHAIRYRKSQACLSTSATAVVMNAIYLDGAYYYFLILMLRLGVCLVYWTAPPSLILLMRCLESGLTSTITARWFLSFRRVLLHSLSPTLTDAQNSRARPHSTQGKLTSNFTGANIDFAIQNNSLEDDTDEEGDDGAYTEIDRSREDNRGIRLICSGPLPRKNESA